MRSEVVCAQGFYSLQFEPRCPVDVLQISFRPGAVIPVHSHNYLELLYLVSGKLTIDIDGRPFTSSKGDLVIMNSGHTHCISNREARRAEAVALGFQPEILQTTTDSGEEITEYLTPFIIQDSFLCPLVGAGTGISAKAHEILNQIAAELPPDSTRARLAARTYLRLLLLLLVKHFASRHGLRDAVNHQERLSQRLWPLFNYIDSHFAEKISVEQASSVIHMSASHFMCYFKRATGDSFLSYLRAYQIAKAKSLLLQTDHSVAEVGWQTSFRSASHFTAVFKGMMGTTPSEYRRSAAKSIAEGEISREPLRVVWSSRNGLLPGRQPRSA